MKRSQRMNGPLAIIMAWLIAVSPILTASLSQTAYADPPAGGSAPDPENPPPDPLLAAPPPPSAVDSDLTATNERAAREFLQIIQDTGRHPFDVFRLIEQGVTKSKESVSWKNISFEIRNNVGEVVKRVYMRDYINQEKSGISDLGLADQELGEQMTISYRDKVIHTFAITPEAIGFYDGNLVFYEKENFVSNGDGESIANVSFIDLERFDYSLGQERLPIYRMPVNSPDDNIKLAQSGENFQVILSDGTVREFSPKVFALFSLLQTVGFDFLFNLSNADTYDDTVELSSQISALFTAALDVASKQAIEEQQSTALARDDVINTLTEVVQARVNSGNLNKDVSKLGYKIAQAYDTEIKKSEKLDKIFATHQGQVANQRKIVTRVRALFARLTLPAPKHAAQSIYSSIVQATGSILGFTKTKGQLKEAVLQLARNKKVYFGAAALFAAATAGDPVIGHFYHESLQVVSAVFEGVWGHACSFGHLSYEAISDTVAGFNPITLAETYVTDGKIGKLAVGMTAAFSTLALIIGVPHVLINTVTLGKELWAERPTTDNDKTWLGFVRSLPKLFVQRQARRQAEYLKALGESDTNGGKVASTQFTPEEDAEAQALVTELRASQSDAFSKLTNFMSRIPVIGRLLKKGNGGIETFTQALRHFLISTCAFTVSGKAYINFWNKQSFMFRSMVLRPILSATFMYYPTYFQKLIELKNGDALPSVFNGGRRPFYQYEWMRLRALFGDKQLGNIERVEAALGPIEMKVEEIAKQRSMNALLAELQELDDVEALVEKGKIPTATNDVMESLTASHRRFFQIHFLRLKTDMMQEILRRQVGNDIAIGDDLKSGDADEIKLKLAENIDAVSKFDLGQLDQIADEVSQGGKIITATREGVKNWWTTLSMWAQRHELAIATTLDPENNRQVERFQSAQKQVKNPQAVARAIRATIASILVDKPLEMIALLVLLAGVTEGINKPLHDVMFSENAWFFIGRYPILTGFISNCVIQALADPWMKLQQDEQNEGSFGERPSEEFQNKSMPAWYLKMFFSPKNTWWKNQKHYYKIIWANMRAALILTIISNRMTIGRTDLDMYLTGYLLAYGLPNNGVAFKAEQAFELATGYYKKDIPEKLDAHPLVQEYLMQRMTKARLWFNFYYKNYENFLGFFLSNLQTISTTALGSRSLVRWLFGGYTPTEIWANSLERAQTALRGVPGMESVIDGCQLFFTRNYTDGDKFIDGVKK